MHDSIYKALAKVADLARQTLASDQIDARTKAMAEAFLMVYADLEAHRSSVQHGGQNKLDLPEAHIVKEYASGRSAAEIAAENECSRASIIRVLKAHGITIRRGRPRGK